MPSRVAGPAVTTLAVLRTTTRGSTGHLVGVPFPATKRYFVGVLPQPPCQTLQHAGIQNETRRRSIVVHRTASGTVADRDRVLGTRTRKTELEA